MGMDGSGLSVADALALQRDNYDDGMFGGNGSWVFFLFFLLGRAKMRMWKRSLFLSSSCSPCQPILPVAPVKNTVFFIADICYRGLSHCSGFCGVCSFQTWKCSSVWPAMVSTEPIFCPVLTLSPAFTEQYLSLQ